MREPGPQIPHLVELGINCVQLLPVLESGLEQGPSP